MKRKRLGEVLQDRGKISAASLQKLFEEQQGKVVRLGELILERGLVDKASPVKAIEEVSRVPYLDCAAVQCGTKILQSVPGAMATRLVVLPIRIDQGRIVIAMAEPQNVTIIDELRFTTGKEVPVHVALGTAEASESADAVTVCATNVLAAHSPIFCEAPNSDQPCYSAFSAILGVIHEFVLCSSEYRTTGPRPWIEPCRSAEGFDGVPRGHNAAGVQTSERFNLLPQPRTAS
jgi:hypothetical protein